MSERKEYELTAEQLNSLIHEMRSIPLIAMHCGPIPSLQERANRAWMKLGDEMGFDGMSVQPIPGRSVHIFTAVSK